MHIKGHVLTNSQCNLYTYLGSTQCITWWYIVLVQLLGHFHKESKCQNGRKHALKHDSWSPHVERHSELLHWQTLEVVPPSGVYFTSCSTVDQYALNSYGSHPYPHINTHTHTQALTFLLFSRAPFRYIHSVPLTAFIRLDVASLLKTTCPPISLVPSACSMGEDGRRDVSPLSADTFSHQRRWGALQSRTIALLMCMGCAIWYIDTDI